LPKLDAPAQTAPSLVREFLQEHRIHRPLEADVEERDVAFSERDDAGAREARRLKRPAVSSWSRLNRSSDSARTTSTSLRSADAIIA